MMLNQPPPDLFPERPVRSEFAQAGISYRTRRIITLSVLSFVLGGAFYMGFGRHHEPSNEPVPVIKAEGSYKQRPQEPGGLEIPHQDVDVYRALDGKESATASAEHLMPAAEVPHPAEENMGFGDLSPGSDAATLHVEHLIPPVSDTGMPILEADKSDVNNKEIPETEELTAPAPAVVTPPRAPAPIKTTVIEHHAKEKAPEKVVEKVAEKPVEKVVEKVTPVVAQVVAPAPVPTPAAVAPAPTAVAATEAKKDDDDADEDAKPAAPPTSGKKGTALQIASVQNQSMAQTTMQQMQSKYASILGATRLHLVRADLGSKGIYYRIQTEPVPEAQAAAMCKSLKNINAGCLIVR